MNEMTRNMNDERDKFRVITNIFCDFSLERDQPTDRQTDRLPDRQMDGQTDRASYRGAMAHLKIILAYF